MRYSLGMLLIFLSPVILIFTSLASLYHMVKEPELSIIDEVDISPNISSNSE